MLSFDTHRSRPIDPPSAWNDEARTAALASKFRPAPPEDGARRETESPGAALRPRSWIGRLFASRRSRPPATPNIASARWTDERLQLVALREQFGAYAVAARAELAKGGDEMDEAMADSLDRAPHGPPTADDRAASLYEENGALPPYVRSLCAALAASTPPDPIGVPDEPASVPRTGTFEGGASGPRVTEAALPESLLRSTAMRRTVGVPAA